MVSPRLHETRPFVSWKLVGDIMVDARFFACSRLSEIFVLPHDAIMWQRWGYAENGKHLKPSSEWVSILAEVSELIVMRMKCTPKQCARIWHGPFDFPFMFLFWRGARDRSALVFLLSWIFRRSRSRQHPPPQDKKNISKSRSIWPLSNPTPVCPPNPGWCAKCGIRNQQMPRF